MEPISAQITRMLSVYKFQDEHAVKSPGKKVWKDIFKAYEDNKKTDDWIRRKYRYTK